MLNSSGEGGNPCLVPDFKGNVFNFSPLRIMFAVCLSYIAFIMLRYVPLFLLSGEIFLHLKSHQLVHRFDTHYHEHIPDKWVWFCVYYSTTLF